MEFLAWMRQFEARVRKLSSPTTYGAKPARKPAKGVDDFIKEIDLLKKDMDALDRKRKGEKAAPPAPKVGDEELIDFGRMTLANLKVSPKYYSDRDEGPPGPTRRRVTREEATRVARQLAIDFKAVKFTPEAFRKGLEAEVARSHKPSTFDATRPAHAPEESVPDDDGNDADPSPDPAPPGGL